MLPKAMFPTSSCCYTQHGLRANLTTSQSYAVYSSLGLTPDAPQFRRVGEWRPLQGLLMDDVLYPNFFRGFNNRTFVVGTTQVGFPIDQKGFMGVYLHSLSGEKNVLN